MFQVTHKPLIDDLSLSLKENKSFRERCRKGEMGKTPQLWLLYIGSNALSSYDSCWCAD